MSYPGSHVLPARTQSEYIASNPLQGLESVLNVVMPRPVRVLTKAGLEEASRWLAESLGTMHIKRDGDVIEVLRVAVVGNRNREGVAGPGRKTGLEIHRCRGPFLRGR